MGWLPAQSVASNKVTTPVFALESAIEFRTDRLWRGIELDGSWAPGVFASVKAAVVPIHLFASIGFSAALTRRETPWRNDLGDQLMTRLYTDWVLFQGRLAVGGGGSLFHSLARSPGSYGATTPEVFLRIGNPSSILNPTFEISWDLTPNQTGAYWSIQLGREWKLGRVPLGLEFRYGHANGFYKQGNYEFLNNIFRDSLYALQDLLPTDLSLVATTVFTLAAGLSLIPTVGVYLSTDPFLNREPFHVVVGIALKGAFGAAGKTWDPQ